jgi:hypothetical protein
LRASTAARIAAQNLRPTAIMTEGVLIMDNLHATLAELRAETKSRKDHLTVFREFLEQLDQLQRHAPAKATRIKSPPRRKQAKPGRGS